MRRLANILLVTLLVFLVTPGLIEAGENFWHLVTEGHGAHSPAAGEDHEPEGDEHGCTGSFHLCTCHRTPPSRTEPVSDLADERMGGRKARQAGAQVPIGPPHPPLDHVPKLPTLLS